MVTPSTPLMVIGAILLAIATVAAFFPRFHSVVIAFAGMLILRWAGAVVFPSSTLIFWGAAALLVVVNHYMLPTPIRNTGSGLGYMAGGALAGLAFGMTLYEQASIVGGAVLGALLGAIAFSRTAAGRPMNFPSSKFFNYLGAKGMPVVVTLSIVGLSLASLIAVTRILHS